MGKNDFKPEDTFGASALSQKIDAEELMDEIGIDQDDIQWRKNFVHFDQDDKERLSRLESLFREQSDQVAQDFYDNLTPYDQTQEIIDKSSRSLNSLKKTQKAYMVTLATGYEGNYGKEYFKNRVRIGKVHDLLEMPNKQYIGQYAVYYDLIIPKISQRAVNGVEEEIKESIDDEETADKLVETVENQIDERTKEMLSFLRIMNLDMQVAIDTYIHAYAKSIDVQEDLAELVDENVQSLLANSQNVSASSQQVSSVIKEVVDSLKGEVDDGVDNLRETIEEISSASRQVEETSQQAEEKAEEGKKSARDAIEKMESVGDSAVSVSDDVDELKDKVDEIDQVVDLIDEIADRTNLLALNASIEAARAGEAGEGFAVVADEVKNLAEESQEQAAEVTDLIEDIREKTDKTVESMEKTNDEIKEGIRQVQDTMHGLNEIVDAVQETSAGISQVSDSTEEQAASTQQVASMVEEIVDRANEVSQEIDSIAEANEEQSEMVEELKSQMEEVKNSSHMGDR